MSRLEGARNKFQQLRAEAANKRKAEEAYRRWFAETNGMPTEQKRDELLKTAGEWGGLLAIMTRYARYGNYTENTGMVAAAIAGAMPEADKIYVQSFVAAKQAGSPAVEHEHVAAALEKDHGIEAVALPIFSPTFFDTYTHNAFLDAIPEDFRKNKEAERSEQAIDTTLEVILNAPRHSADIAREKVAGLGVGYVALVSTSYLNLNERDIGAGDIKSGSGYLLEGVDREAGRIVLHPIVEVHRVA
jgi:hypothetical protein